MKCKPQNVAYMYWAEKKVSNKPRNKESSVRTGTKKTQMLFVQDCLPEKTRDRILRERERENNFNNLDVLFFVSIVSWRKRRCLER